MAFVVLLSSEVNTFITFLLGTLQLCFNLLRENVESDKLIPSMSLKETSRDPED